MRAFTAFFASAIAVFASVGTAKAENNLLCKTELTAADGTQTDFFRQYQFSSGTVTVYDKEGDQWLKRFTTGYQYAFNNRLIIIANTPATYHEINRVTGMMFSYSILTDGGRQRRRGMCSSTQ